MSNKSLLPIQFRQNVSMGCDPEFFFADRRGEVVGSEKILGINNKLAGVIIDGVQAELNPGASSCRESLASGISSCFLRLRNSNYQVQSGDVTVKMDSLVDISQSELDSLSDASRRFGCAPSTNIYNTGDDKTSEIKANPTTYLKRSAGGHIHLGNYVSGSLDAWSAQSAPCDYKIAKQIERALKEIPEIMVPVLDIIVGNTCVLLDQQIGNKERRENYGRAGEFRLKSYGIEYRTLSNFWLRSYQLMSLVMGLSRFAVHIVSESTPENDYVKALFEAVSRDDIAGAINGNDFDLAMANFKKIEPIILMATGNGPHGYYPLSSTLSMKMFYHFVFRIQQKGLEYWFPQDPMTHWTGEYNIHGGWEKYSNSVISKDFHRLEIEKNRTIIDLNAQPVVATAVTTTTGAVNLV